MEDGVINMSDVIALSPKEMHEKICEVSVLLLDYYEEHGFHHPEEVTAFLHLIAESGFIHGNFIIDVAKYTGEV